MSVEMQKATMADQAVVNDFENDDYSYADNQPIQETKPLLDEDAEKSAIAEIKKGNTNYEDVAELYDLTDEQIKTLQHAGI
jgi:recombination protein RecT